MALLMMLHFERFFFVVQLLVFFTVFPRFTNLAALFVRLSPPLIHITTILLHFLWVSWSRSPQTSLQSRTLSALWTGLSLINITIKLCVPLMCAPCSLMHRLMKQFKFVSISCTLSLSLRDYHDQPLKLCLSLQRRKATSYLTDNIMIRLMVLLWGHHWVLF